MQAGLDWPQFEERLEGYDEVRVEDMLDMRGGRVRYMIEVMDPRVPGRVSSRLYRLGGVLTHVDPQLRYLKLRNVAAGKNWSVQLRKPGERVRLWYMSPATDSEAIAIRTLLRKLESGELTLTRREPGGTGNNSGNGNGNGRPSSRPSSSRPSSRTSSSRDRR